jgi:hypothetical protein
MNQGSQAYLSLPLRYVGDKDTNVERLIRCLGCREAENDGSRACLKNRPTYD